MITAKNLQNLYVKLYRTLREYVWPYKHVCEIANLELAVYKAFPDLDEVRAQLSRLKSMCYDVIADDEAMQEAFDEFDEFLNEATDVYTKLDTRAEGVVR